MKAYLNMIDAESIYTRIRGTQKGINAYKARIKSIAVKSDNAYIFKDEEKLFRFCQEYFGEELTIRKINSFGELMQYVF